jgi:hypothetical protein
MDEFEVDELRQQRRKQRRSDHLTTRAAFMGEELADVEWPNPNQPRCTAGANGMVAARKAIQLAMPRKNSKVEEGAR